MQVVLSDFELARSVQQFVTRTLTRLIGGTPAYMAPEVLKGGKEPSLAADVWAFGVMLLQAFKPSLELQLLHEGGQVLQQALQMPASGTTRLAEHEKMLMEKAFTLLREVLKVDPAKRPPIHWVLAHPFFVAPAHTVMHQVRFISTISLSFVDENLSLSL
jgi:serine/threonine protein kinase